MVLFLCFDSFYLRPAGTDLGRFSVYFHFLIGADSHIIFFLCFLILRCSGMWFFVFVHLFDLRSLLNFLSVGTGSHSRQSGRSAFFHFAVKPFFLCLDAGKAGSLRLDGICLFHGSAVIALFEGNCGRVGSGVFCFRSRKIRYSWRPQSFSRHCPSRSRTASAPFRCK